MRAACVKTSQESFFSHPCATQRSAGAIVPPSAAPRVSFMTRFRPCIDLHNGQVKQIVGGSLTTSEAELQTNFVAEHTASWYAERYRADQCTGGHVIMLGPGNQTAAEEALAAWPGGLQVGGGITIDNAKQWLDAGAGQIIVTSWLFPNGAFAPERLQALAQAIGPERIVIDLSCRQQGDGWVVAMNKWQTLTTTPITAETFTAMNPFCREYLIHAADVEGKCEGIDNNLVHHLSTCCDLPITYAGGGKDLNDLQTIHDLSNGHIDLTFGSALDLFGGSLVRYQDCLTWNTQHTTV